MGSLSKGDDGVCHLLLAVKVKQDDLFKALAWSLLYGNYLINGEHQCHYHPSCGFCAWNDGADLRFIPTGSLLSRLLPNNEDIVLQKGWGGYSPRDCSVPLLVVVSVRHNFLL